MKVKGEGGREVSRRCPRPEEEEEELVVVVFAMLPSSEQRAVGRAAPAAGQRAATNLPTCAGEPPRCCSFQPIILPQSLSPRLRR